MEESEIIEMVNKDHWEGRVCKVYAKIGLEWKMTMHTGVLEY
jgi:hypothetical protein